MTTAMVASIVGSINYISSCGTESEWVALKAISYELFGKLYKVNRFAFDSYARFNY